MNLKELNNFRLRIVFKSITGYYLLLFIIINLFNSEYAFVRKM